MKKTIFIILGLALAFCFGFFIKTIMAKQSDNNVNGKNKEINKMKKVIGVGGIFFKCKDPNKVKEWYKTHLGFDIGQYGTSFEWQEGADTTKKGSLQWSPFSETTKYFEPSTKDFMINYRVDNLVDLVEQLKTEGVTILDAIETYPFGKFVHIMDLEGNKIELYEPNNDHVKSDK